MAIYRTVLIIILTLICLPHYANAARNSCLTCHKVHYAGQGSCVECHRGNSRTDRKKIAHSGLIAGRFAQFSIQGNQETKRGEKLMEELACRRCHIVGRKGNRLASNLARLAPNALPEDIFQSIKSPVLFMPDFHCTDLQITALVNAILAGAEPTGATVRETAYVVHFEDQQHGLDNIFIKKCGPCHKVLSEKTGGLGSGETAPNLSGLLSEFYPKTFQNGEPWTAENLRKWLENPRKLRGNARMQPVRLNTGESALLLGVLKMDSK